MAVPASRGVYRLPYATGTTVRVLQDDQTHSKARNRYDLGSRSADKRVVAAAAGVVQVIVDHHGENRPGRTPCNNNYVWIAHPTGEWTKYTHMSQGSVREDANLRVGDRVEAGRMLGFEDEVGCAHGKHLHFEVAVPLDPNDAIDEDGFIRGGQQRNRIPWVFGATNHKLVKGDEHQAVPIPPLLIEPTQLHFGTVVAPLTEKRELTVANTSGRQLRLSAAASTSGPFRWPAFDRVINDQERATLTLLFRPTGLGSTTAKLHVVIDAPPNSGLPPTRTVTLTGTGIGDGDPHHGPLPAKAGGRRP